MRGEQFSSISAQHQVEPLGAMDITAAVLGAVSPASAPGYQLQLVRREWMAGASSTKQSPSGAFVSCVASGELTVELQDGTVMLRRGQVVGWPTVELLVTEVPVVCRIGDCVTVDQDTVPTVITVWNVGREPAVVWETHLSLIPLSRHWQCG
jgi:hypothetical protein